jgi:hypothetical protein
MNHPEFHAHSGWFMVTPAVVGLRGNLQLAAYVGDLFALGQHPIRPDQLAHNLLCECRFLVAIVIVLPAHNAGRQDSHSYWTDHARSRHHIVNYLIAEVLDGQPQHRRSFLLRTSVLRRLGGALCDAVLESTGSAAILADIERENLFLTSLDDSRHSHSLSPAVR